MQGVTTCSDCKTFGGTPQKKMVPPGWSSSKIHTKRLGDVIDHAGACKIPQKHITKVVRASTIIAAPRVWLSARLESENNVITYKYNHVLYHFDVSTHHFCKCLQTNAEQFYLFHFFLKQRDIYSRITPSERWRWPTGPTVWILDTPASVGP